SRNVHVISPDNTVQDAANIMADINAGVVPVGEGDRLVGMLTDRDIAIRAVAAGMGPDARVRDVMTNDVKYCFEDEDIDHVCANLGDQQVRRLPVVSRDKRLVGILSLGDLALKGDGSATSETLSEISRPGGSHAT
ncbi:MAG: CBS domain-containing protein, partial [Pseudorhodobacter sp.]|nr:CBS domain-containing protein [Pseudorhodobacter sp.]